MSRRIAIKELTASDLTLFEWHFRNKNAGNQKAINLNANVFTGILYPALSELAEARHGRLPIDMFIYGPGLEGELNLQRKIVKHGTYKNWRLDGEFIFNPVESPERFNILQPHDYVVLEFIGEFAPVTVKALFVANAAAEDQTLHHACQEFVGNKRMVALPDSELHNLVMHAAPSGEHPIHELLLEADLEDAALGGVEGTYRLLRRSSGRRMSQSDLQQARENAETIGQRGEEFVNVFLSQQLSAGAIQTFDWVSQENAISPYDFITVEASNEQVLIDAKSTSGEFGRKIHISTSELTTMATDDRRYDLYRIYEIDEESAKLRVARNLKELAVSVIDNLAELPAGVSIDSISVSPDLLRFDPEIDVTIPDEYEGDGIEAPLPPATE